MRITSSNSIRSVWVGKNFEAILKAYEEFRTETVIAEQDKVYDGMTEL